MMSFEEVGLEDGGRRGGLDPEGRREVREQVLGVGGVRHHEQHQRARLHGEERGEDEHVHEAGHELLAVDHARNAAHLSLKSAQTIKEDLAVFCVAVPDMFCHTP